MTPEFLLPGDHKAPRRYRRSNLFYLLALSKWDCYLPAAGSGALCGFSSLVASLEQVPSRRKALLAPAAPGLSLVQPCRPGCPKHPAPLFVHTTAASVHTETR